MKKRPWKRILCCVLSLLLILGVLPVAALGAESEPIALPKEPGWEGFEAFSSEVSALLEETMEEDYISGISLEVGESEMVVDGETQPVVEGRKVTPVTKDEVILLPVRALAEQENAAVSYNSATSTATVRTADGEIAFTQGEETAMVSDGEGEGSSCMPMSTEPELIDGTMYVPLDTMANFLGYEAEIVEDKVLLTKPYQTKRLIVKSSAADLEDHGAIKEISGFQDLHVLQYETEQEARDAQIKLMLSEEVDYVEPDLVVSTAEVHKSWGTDYIGADFYNTFLQENTSLDEVVVAVVDSGVDSEHEFLKDRVIPVNKNFVNEALNSNDDNGHGTHVSGIIRDATLSNVKILPVKTLNDQGKGTSLSVYNGVMFAISQNCDIINMSLGAIGKSELEREMVLEAVSHNIPVVVSAGNDNVDAMAATPANIEEAITVGAIVYGSFCADYSNYGKSIDIWAPGSNINSSVPGDKYVQKSGTSMASPFVAAAAAMLKTYDKTLSPRQIEGILQKYADQVAIGEPNNPGTSKVLNVRPMRRFESFSLPAVETPVADAEPGEYYQEELSITLSCPTPGAVIRYTTDGTAPTENNGEVYTGPITLNQSTRLLAKAFLEGAAESYTLDHVYFISPYPESMHYQEYSYYDTWKYTCPDKTAKYLKITFDENTYLPFPEATADFPGYREYGTARKLEYGLFLYDADGNAVNNECGDIDRAAFLFDEPQGNSVIVKGNEFSLLLEFPLTERDYGFRIKSVEPLYEERLSVPVFVTPHGNTYKELQYSPNIMFYYPSKIHYEENMTVEIRSEEGGDIYYTLDGSVPTKDSLRYTGPITLDEPRKIRARAYKEGYVESAASSEVYYSSQYPESLHYAKRQYYFNYVWEKYQAPEDVKYMAVTFDEKTNLSNDRSSSPLSPELTFSDQTYQDMGSSFDRTEFHGKDLTGQTVLIKGNWFSLRWLGNQPEGLEPPYGFKITDITYYYEDDLVPIESIEISGDDSVYIGKQAQLTASFTPANANVGILWRNTDKYASVDDNGVVTGLSEGSERIFASSRLVNNFSNISNGSHKDISVKNAPVPEGKITYSTKKLTKRNVVATITPSGSSRVVNNEGSNSYTFTENGEFAFELENDEGGRASVVAKVDWIDKEPPTATLTYSPGSATNGEVLVTMHPSEEVTVTNTENHSESIRMTKNGSVRFEFADKAGNTGSVEGRVTWIQKSDISVDFSYEDLPDGTVKATLLPSKPVTVTNNGGSSEHIFTENGSFTFTFKYGSGKTGFATANVCWIYEAFITYDMTEPTNHPVTASIHLPSDVAITNNGGSDTYVFEENGSFTFEYMGFDGHTGSLTAQVTWIDHDLTVDIASLEELTEFAKRVNEGESFVGVTVRLVRDIDMKGCDWTPIGDYRTRNRFGGTFDGQNFTIFNFATRTRIHDSFYGLFGMTATSTVIRNVRIEEYSLRVGSTCGGLAGWNEGTIENCFVSGEIEGSSELGGIVGSNCNNGIIRACHMDGTIVSSGINAGGIAGNSSYNSLISGCSANVKVIGSESNIGGIAGSTRYRAVIENCCTAGRVTGNSALDGIGGIIGNLNGTVRNSFSVAAVENAASGGTYFGGIAGRLEGESKAENCIALNPSVTIINDTAQIGRVVGACEEVSGKAPVLAGNYAWKGMQVGVKGDEITAADDAVSPLTHINGKGVNKEKLHTKAFWKEAGFSLDGGAWVWTKGKMPCPESGEVLDWPQWLRLEEEPAPASLTKAPVAKEGLVYTGKPQELIEPGEAEGGTVEYCLTENGEYSEALPAEINAGTYTVWYRVTGDDEHTDLSPASLPVTIAKAARPKELPEDLSVPAGTALSSLQLPEGWSWKDPGQELAAGENQVIVVYGDTKNYEQTEFTITITMAASELTYEITEITPSRIPETGSLKVKLSSGLQDIYDQLSTHTVRLSLTASNGEKSTLDVRFQLREEDNQTYDPMATGTYTLTGCLSELPENIQNPKGLQVKIAVEVEKYRIDSIVPIRVYGVHKGTAFEDLPLPECATVVRKDGGKEEVPTIWNKDDYQPDKEGYHVLHGTLATPLPVYLENPYNRQPMCMLQILDETPPTATVSYSPDKITNQDVTATITPSEDVTVINNGGSLSHTFTENGSFTFEFEDNAGNKGTAAATVDWIDKEPPVITLLGDNPLSLKLGEEYEEPGVEVTDNRDEKIESKLLIDASNVDTEKAGTYTVKYSVTDSAGNHAETTRTVKVEPADHPAPPDQPDVPSPGPAPDDPEVPKPCPKDETCPMAKFTDVNRGKWYHDGIHFALENSLFAGITETEFGPDVPASRAMLASVLYRLEGKPKVSELPSFADVKEGRYYTEAVAWAAKQGIVAGYSEARFGPDDSITREQLVSMLYRYAGEPNTSGSLEVFTDSGKASKYAKPALCWAVEQGILSGKGNGVLDPKGRATRAEVASMLERYCKRLQNH